MKIVNLQAILPRYTSIVENGRVKTGDSERCEW